MLSIVTPTIIGITTNQKNEYGAGAGSVEATVTAAVGVERHNGYHIGTCKNSKLIKFNIIITDFLFQPRQL